MARSQRDIQADTTISEATFSVESGTAVNDGSTFAGYTLQQVVQALQDQGVLK